MKIKQELKAFSRVKAGGQSPSALLRAELTHIRDLHILLIRDVAESVDYDAERDIETLLTRYRHEGFALMSKTLPKMDKALLEGLQEGFYQQTYFKRASKRGVRLALPSFTLGLLNRIFDAESGLIKPRPDYTAIAALHQIYSFTYKYEVELPDDVVVKCIEQMIDTDRSLPSSLHYFSIRGEYPISDSDFVLTKARLLLDTVFRDCDLEKITPRHGPGASNEVLKPHEKYHFTRLSRKLTKAYCPANYFAGTVADFFARNPLARKVIVSSGSVQGSFSVDPKKVEQYVSRKGRPDEITLSEFMSMCSKVCPVPKNSTTARIISSEPVGNMWVQQGQSRKIVNLLGDHPLTKGHVNFDDQTINQDLAIRGSLNGNLATIDLSEASDRVSRALAYALLPNHIYKALDASRSEYSMIVWPNGNKSYIRLNKFAPMGNGFCFPIESVIFWALSVACIQVLYNVGLETALECVFVYGDDIIVPSHFSSGVMDTLPSFGFKVNTHKSYSRGLFRESCGMDAFGGVDVTPLKLKTRAPRRISQAESISGWVDFANECKSRGYMRLYGKMKSHIERLTGPLPSYPRKIGILTWVGEDTLVSTEEPEPIDRSKPWYQGRVVRGWALQVRKYKPVKSEFPEWLALMRRIVTPSLKDNGHLDKEHPIALMIDDVRCFALRYAVKLKRKRVFLT
jgi:hypothetical protein